MCDQLVSFAEFRAILTPFSEVIRKAFTEIIGRPVTPSIAGLTVIDLWPGSQPRSCCQRGQIQMDQSELRVKPSCEFPLLTARSQASEGSRRGEF